MDNILMDIIYDKIKAISFYNYDNVELREYVNILGNKIIDIILEDETYTISCIKTYANKESEE